MAPSFTSRQTGASSLLAVLVLLALGGLVMGSQARQQMQRSDHLRHTTQALQQWNHALSAQAWGTRQHWQPEKQWQCQRQNTEGWRACVKLDNRGRVLLAATGENAPTPLALWRWGERIDGNVRWFPDGWIDFCPLPEEAECRIP